MRLTGEWFSGQMAVFGMDVEWVQSRPMFSARDA
jgi:hypothetical protein